jgi:HSP20 family molecular chaperone IbpA
MAEKQELRVQTKQEVETAHETTRPTRAFIPSADIYESEIALTVVLGMPDVNRDGIDVNIEGEVLTIEAASTSQNTTDYSLSTASITSSLTGAAFAFRVSSIRTASQRSQRTASLP